MKIYSRFFSSPSLWKILVVLLLACTLNACASKVSVKHLTREPLVSEDWGRKKTLSLKVVSFEYVVMRVRTGGIGLKGSAKIDWNRVPLGLTRVEDFVLTGYLCDASGKVLAQAQQSYLPTTRALVRRLDFDLLLPDVKVSVDKLQVTFGYKAVFVSPKKGKKEGNFFVSEGALTTN